MIPGLGNRKLGAVKDSVISIVTSSRAQLIFLSFGQDLDH